MPSDISRQLEGVLNSIGGLNNSVSSLKGKADLLIEQNQDYEDRLKQYTEGKELYRKAIVLVGQAGETARVAIKSGFEGIVTHALRSIVGEDYTFEIVFEKRGNVQEANFNVKTKELGEPFDPIDSRGGGIVDIVSIALRVSLLELFQPRIEGPIILDEPFKHLSKEYIQSAGEFLDGVATKMGRQIILVTHIRELTNEADKVIEL
jgi:DNA repair exonuclease SbcCD ATPase subunit